MKSSQKNIEPLKISQALSTLLVKMETELKKNPNISLRKFVEKLGFDPIDLLYSHGFSALIYFALLVPLKEVLDKNLVGNDWDNLRRLRNGLCHGTYEIRNYNLVVRDRKGEIEITPQEAVRLSNKLASFLYPNQ